MEDTNEEEITELTSKFSNQNLDSPSSYFPLEITQDILSRLPSKPLLRFQTVSKSWYTMISELRLSRFHIITEPSSSSVENPCGDWFMWQSYVSEQRRNQCGSSSQVSIEHSDWKALLPANQHQVYWKSASMGFSIEQRTGKNCFTLGPERLKMSKGEKLNCDLKIRVHPGSRIPEVAELEQYSKKLVIRGELKMEMLSPNTYYAAYLLFSFIKRNARRPANSLITEARKAKGVLKSRLEQIAVSRGDGLMEVEIGEMLVTKGDNRDMEAVVSMQMGGCSMTSLSVEGIEFRPSGTQITLTASKKD